MTTISQRRRWSRCGPASIGLVMTVIGGLSGAPGSEAQNVLFSPEISLGARYVDNLEFLDQGGSSDISGRLSLVLPVTRNFKNEASLRFTYNPVFERFQDSEVLDNTEHRLSLTLDLRPQPTASLLFEAFYQKSQDQIVDLDLDVGPELFLSERTDRETQRLRMLYQRQFGTKWATAISASIEQRLFDPIAGLPADFEAVQFEDRSEARGDWRVTRVASARSQWGFFYGLRRFDLDVVGDETLQSGGLLWNHRPSARSDLQLTLGGFYSTGAAAEGLEGTSDSERTGLQVVFGYERRYRTALLKLSAKREPSVGGALLGTSTDSSLGLAVEVPVRQRATWEYFVRYTERDPTIRNQPTLKAVTLGAQVEFRLSEKMGLRLNSASLFQQNDRDGDATLFRAGVEWVWYPLAGTPLGGRR